MRLGSKIPADATRRTVSGARSKTGSAFSDFGTALSELAWRQTLLDGQLKFVFGKISATSWYNIHALTSAMTGFQNIGLRTSVSKPTPGRGPRRWIRGPAERTLCGACRHS